MSQSTKSSRRRTLITSFVFTPEEAKYLKAVLRWNASPDTDDGLPSKRRPPPTNKPSPPQHAPPPPPPTNTPQLRLLVLGVPGVGKSTLINHLSQTPLLITSTPHTLIPTELPLPFPLSTPPDADSLSRALTTTDAAVLVYSVRDATTLTPLLANAQLRAHATRKGYPMVLVGTQADCAPGERQVPWAAGARAAGGVGIGEFVEVSGRTGEGVGRVGEVLGREVGRVKGEEGKKEEGGRGGVGAGGRGKRGGLWRIFGRGSAARGGGRGVVVG
ncbi:hypothetical protein QBC39DRAFT_374837 [Podospora conica]|nr:hypothetical protein QBC39DRAFT_374837 [Schizothecium conicum]